MFDNLFVSRVRNSGGPYVTLENMVPKPKLGHTCAVRIKEVIHGKIGEFYTTITDVRGNPVIRIPDGLGGFESGDNVVMAVSIIEIDRAWFMSDLSVGMAEFAQGKRGDSDCIGTRSRDATI